MSSVPCGIGNRDEAIGGLRDASTFDVSTFDIYATPPRATRQVGALNAAAQRPASPLEGIVGELADVGSVLAHHEDVAGALAAAFPDGISSLKPPLALAKAIHSPSSDQAACASLPGLREPLDVRDVADLHLRAMTHPDANRERFIAVAGHAMSMRDIALVLKARLGPRSSEDALVATAGCLMTPGALNNS